MSTTDLTDERRELLKVLLEEEGVEISASQRISQRESKDEIPLSFAQQRLWFFDQLNPGNPFYNTFQPIVVKGRLSIAAFEQSLNEIIRRHEVLRTTIWSLDGQPIQVVAPTLKLTLAVTDLREIADPRRQPMSEQLMDREYRRPFDLAQGPLWRVTLLQLSEEEHVVLMTMHHIVSDGWSLGLLCGEIAALYDAFSTGGQFFLAELPIQYADFAKWQLEYLQGEVMEKHLSYWKNQLAGVAPLLELPSDRPRSPVFSFRGSAYAFRLPETLSAALKDLSQQEGTTLFMTLLAAFKVLLQRYTGIDDIVVGSAIANRNRREIEGLIGFFINSLVLRTDLSGSPSFRELLSRVKTVTLGAYNHQDLPFEKLVEVLQPKRNLGYAPLCQVEFTLQNAPVGELKVRGLTLSGAPTVRKTAETDFNMMMWESPGGLIGAVNYSTDLFDRSTVARMISHFQTLLENIVTAPEKRISELTLLTETEREKLKSDWQKTRVDFPADKTITELFEAQVEETPEATAVVMGGRQLTYRELNRRANQLAHHLSKLGVGPESLVGICVERSFEMVAGLLGILKAGGAYVPLDPAYPKERLALMLEDAQISLLLIQERLAPGLLAHQAQTIQLDTEWETFTSESAENPVPTATAQNPAYAIFTSGSTGRPNAALITHQALVNYAIGFINAVGLRDTDRILQFASISFDVAVEELFPTWLSGAAVVLRNDPLAPSYTELTRLVEEESLTAFELPTSYWHEWVYELYRTGTRLPSTLRFVIIGGDKVSPTRLEMWRALGIPLINVYGLTETTVTTTVFHLPAESSSAETWPELPIGSPLANMQVYLLDSRLQPVPAGVTGEIYIGGESLAREYLNRPDLTAQKFIQNRFSDAPGARMYKTGDLAKYLPDGNLIFLGRVDQQVKLRGYRIEPGEIEAALKEHADVKEAVVLVKEEAAEIPPLVSRNGDGQLKVGDAGSVVSRLTPLGEATAEPLFAEVEKLSEDEVETILALELQHGVEEEVRTRRFNELEISLRLKDKKFISPPHQAQRNWVIRRALDEFADDLRALDQVTKQFVPGSARPRLGAQLEWGNSEARFDQSQLIIGNQQVMQDWEHPLMKAMAEVVTETHGDVLELGFGMAISATYIQEFGVRSYTVVEANREVARYFQEWKSRYPGRDIRMIQGKWHDVADQIESEAYDGVFFDTVPTDEQEYTREVIDNAVMAEDFFPVAARSLRKGGVFTWYTNEIDSLSRRHQRLILKYFSSFSVSIVKPLAPPVDCHYWFADSMAVVKAVK